MWQRAARPAKKKKRISAMNSKSESMSSYQFRHMAAKKPLRNQIKGRRISTTYKWHYYISVFFLIIFAILLFLFLLIIFIVPFPFFSGQCNRSGAFTMPLFYDQLIGYVLAGSLIAFIPIAIVSLIVKYAILDAQRIVCRTGNKLTTNNIHLSNQTINRWHSCIVVGTVRHDLHKLIANCRKVVYLITRFQCLVVRAELL